MFTPGQNYDLKLTVIGDTYSVYVDGSSIPADTLTDATFSHGQIGLYDNQPNTTSGKGSGPAQSFSNFSLSDNSVPEPASLGLLTIGAIGLLARRRK